MKCPYCLENFHENWEYFETTTMLQSSDITIKNKFFLKENGDIYNLRYSYCPSCSKLIIQIGIVTSEVIEKIARTQRSLRSTIGPTYFKWSLIKPKNISRVPLPKEVPLKYATDYNESCLVLPFSPKASAALSRRCLQNLLIEKAGAKGKDLSQQIQYVLDSKELPSDLAEALDAIRNIGNFAAHPIKSKSSGEIIEVEPGESEWNLDTLEALFDFYFVRPAILAKKKEALNEKLKEAGKPPMKEF